MVIVIIYVMVIAIAIAIVIVIAIAIVIVIVIVIIIVIPTSIIIAIAIFSSIAICNILLIIVSLATSALRPPGVQGSRHRAGDGQVLRHRPDAQVLPQPHPPHRHLLLLCHALALRGALHQV